MPPCPITLAIDEFDALPSSPAGDEAMHMTVDAQQLQAMLVQGLRDARAASRIVMLSELRERSEADIVIKPRLLGPVTFEYEGWANTWWASGGLWLVTWIGGMAVNDSTYTSSCGVDCSYQFGRSGNPVPKRPYASEAADVTFLERNDFFSWPTVQSLILPPFLTTDQQDSTRDLLTRRAIDSVALEVADDLKRGFEVDAQKFDRCAVVFDAPENGSSVAGDTVTVRGTVTAEASIAAIAVSVNGADPVPATLEIAQAAGGDDFYRSSFRCSVGGLRMGVNYLRVSVTAGLGTTRTLVVTRTSAQ